MATVDQRDLPVHLAAELTGGTDLVVLAPAQRWRTLIDGVSHHQGDVLLTTVARLSAVGCETVQISEALQLPHDLIAHLVARVRLERIKVASDRRTLVSESATLGWTYRDLITDDLSPVIGPESPPVEVRWRQDQATFSAGTTGNPRQIRAAALFSTRSDPARPTPNELVRLASGRGQESRLTLVGASEPCLLVHPVQVLDGEVVVTDVAARPQLHLTRELHETARVRPALRAWLERAIETEPVLLVPERENSALGRSVVALFRARHDFQSHRSARTAEQVLDAVQLVLRRYCTEMWFRVGVDPAEIPPATVDPRSFASAFDLPESDAAALLGAQDPEARRTAQDLVRLALESRHRVELVTTNAVAIARLGAEFVQLRDTTGQFERLDRCAREAEDLARHALEDHGGRHG